MVWPCKDGRKGENENPYQITGQDRTQWMEGMRKNMSDRAIEEYELRDRKKWQSQISSCLAYSSFI